MSYPYGGGGGYPGQGAPGGYPAAPGYQQPGYPQPGGFAQVRYLVAMYLSLLLV